MASVFRKGLFGYNKEDVHRFLQQQAAQYSKEREAHEQSREAHETERKKLQRRIAELEGAMQTLGEQNQFLNGQLERFLGKEEEMERMSVGIGNMYLTAQKDAADIIQRAEECSARVAEQSKKQILAANAAEQALSRVKESVLSAAEDLAGEIDSVTAEMGQLRQDMSGEVTALQGETPAVLEAENQNE